MTEGQKSTICCICGRDLDDPDHDPIAINRGVGHKWDRATVRIDLDALRAQPMPGVDTALGGAGL